MLTRKREKLARIKKKLNILVSKPESINFWLETKIETKYYISTMKKLSLFADTKLRVDQIKKKIDANFIKPLFI